MKWYALVFIFLLAVFVRFYALGQNPVGLIDDEADKGYDSYSLLKTGRDQWGRSWPLVAFKGFGDYRAPLYTYLALPPIAALGLTAEAIRIPSALFGSLTVLITYFFAGELFRGKKFAAPVALVAAFLLAVSPWHIGMSRIAAEVTVGVGIATTGFTLLLLGRRKPSLLPLTGVLFALSVYTYPAYAVFVPLTAAAFLIFFRKDFPKKQSILAAVIFVLAIAPLVTGADTAGAVRMRQTNLTTESGTVDLLNLRRGDCAAVFPPAICRFALNKYYIFAEKFVTNYFSHFSPNLLGITGSTTQYSILPPRGLLYLVELPLLLAGVIYAIKTNSVPGMFLIVFLLVSAIPDSITGTGHFGRFFISLPGWQILTAYALVMLKKYRVILAGVAILLIVEMSAFAVDYVTFFPREYASFSHYGYREVVRQIETNRGKYDKILVSSAVHDAKQYIFYLFYARYDPAAFQDGVGVEKGLDSLGWVRVERVGSVYFIPELPRTAAPGVLYIGAPSEFPKAIYPNIVFTVPDIKGNIEFEGARL